MSILSKKFSDSSVPGVYPEFIPESCSPDSQQGNVSSLDFLSGVAKKSAFLVIFLLTLFENTLKYPYVSQQANINRQ